MVLGIGSGWQPNEHAAYGIALPAWQNAVLDGLCRDIGRCPGKLARACGGTVMVRPGPASGRTAGEHDVHGTPREVLSQMLAFRDAGADEFIVRDAAATVPARQALDQIDILTQAVLPGLT